MSWEQSLEGLPCLYLQRDTFAATGTHALGILARDQVQDSARFFLSGGFYLEDMSGLECAEGAVSVYRYGHFDLHARVTLLCMAPYEDAEFPSIAGIYQGAEWHERETRDFYGFRYPGNPNFIPLLMPETMPDVHPLHKAETARAPLRVLFPTLTPQADVLFLAPGFALATVMTLTEPPLDVSQKEAGTTSAFVSKPGEGKALATPGGQRGSDSQGGSGPQNAGGGSHV